VIQRAVEPLDGTFEQRATLAIRDLNRRVSPRFPDTLANVYAGPLVGKALTRPGQESLIGSRLGWVAAIVLVIACANVINLLLARAVRRRREIAVRLALGVSRARLVRLLTVETVVLAGLAGMAALFVAWAGGTLLRGLLLPNVTWYESVLHWRVVVFAGAATLLAGVVAGVIPALQASNPELTQSLKEGAREGAVHKSRLRTAMVVTQAAFSVVLLMGAALFVRSLNNVKGLDIGYDADRLAFGNVQFEAGQRQPRAVVAAAMAELAARLEGRPGVEGVARSFMVPMRGISFTTFYWGNDSSLSLRPNSPTHSPVSASFFQTVGTRIVRGTTFEDHRGAPKQVVINEAMAGRMWPGRDALGQCIRFVKRDADCYSVVGIAENARQGYVIEDPKPMFYLPLENLPETGPTGSTLIVRARAGAMSAVRAEMTTELRRLFPGADVQVRTMTEELEPEYRSWRLGAELFSAFGVLALLVAVIGIYSTVSYGVTQRRHEFGVRVALGARISDVLRQVIGEGLRVVTLGVVVGVVLALAAGKLIASLLYGVAPWDPVVMLTVSLILLLVAAVAAFMPAWRAARVDPVTALRME
jgi:predicted permease